MSEMRQVQHQMHASPRHAATFTFYGHLNLIHPGCYLVFYNHQKVVPRTFFFYFVKWQMRPLSTWLCMTALFSLIICHVKDNNTI